MSKTKKPFNPFYTLLLIVGVAFVITACSYGVMILKKSDIRAAAKIETSGEGLLEFMDQHGAMLMTVEIAVLLAAALAAIGTDDFWTRRAERKWRPGAAERPEPKTGV